MSDYIDRQAAIDDIKEIYEWHDNVTKERIIEHFKQLPSAPQWIPCSERLPKKADGKYWVCTDTGYQCQCRWTDDVYGLGVSGEWTWKIFDIPQFSHVVAWMPLPEPYKDGEQNEL